jgi:hypothetical protein
MLNEVAGQRATHLVHTTSEIAGQRGSCGSAKAGSLSQGEDTLDVLIGEELRGRDDA